MPGRGGAIAALVRQAGVVGLARVAVRVDVDGGADQPGDAVGELVPGVGGDLVGVEQAEPGVDHDSRLGVQAVTDPAQPQTGDVAHAGDVAQGPLGPVDQFGLDPVHEPVVDLAGGVLGHEHDGDGDGEPDDRIGPAPSPSGADGRENDG